MLYRPKPTASRRRPARQIRAHALPGRFDETDLKIPTFGIPTGPAIREPPRSTLMPASRLQTVALMLGVVGLAACTSTEEGLIEQGYPPAYAEGFEHGCASGKAAAGGLFEQAQKDQNRYQASASEYAQGWDAGYAKCLADMRTMVVDARNRKPSRDK
jgi:hypothetical protein